MRRDRQTSLSQPELLMWILLLFHEQGTLADIDLDLADRVDKEKGIENVLAVLRAWIQNPEHGKLQRLNLRRHFSDEELSLMETLTAKVQHAFWDLH